MISKFTANQRAKWIADRTQDAFSFERYGKTEWRKAARMMVNRGFAEPQIESVLRSKWMRWAADAANSSRGKAEHLDRYLDAQAARRRLDKGLTELVIDTYSKETAAAMPRFDRDLAGACEGEDIAELIDLAREMQNRAYAGESEFAQGLRRKAAAILARIEERAK